MNEELVKNLKSHIQLRLLDSLGHEVDQERLEDIVENIEKDIEHRINGHIDTIEPSEQA